MSVLIFVLNLVSPAKLLPRVLFLLRWKRYRHQLFDRLAVLVLYELCVEDAITGGALITCVETRECHGGPRVKHIVATISGEDFEAKIMDSKATTSTLAKS